MLEVGLMNSFFRVCLSLVLVPGYMSIQICLHSYLVEFGLSQNFCRGVLLLLRTAFRHLELDDRLSEILNFRGLLWRRANTVISVCHCQGAYLVLKYSLTIRLNEIAFLLLTVSITIVAEF